ncbi:Aldo/keto reductase [Cucurbitaria berberidis CBS 394.84]|uniref:Aldo/keto reductase n=1 Tax=Cucurbitaria berberidis CBS 394.84 TaxID=1168544 RepID=A0A9P4GCX9_9PLEO|nr:Aldo/keto reductase [Cucurbitaria berberidis CBS 394.84]KAF1843285.1 Aldo/keto reductase [Cucurbitaria berberidis CBS 394.84]
MADPQSYVLNNGEPIPAIGFGTWDPDNPEGAYAATKYALEAGYRHLDCASLYNNEELVGRAIFEFLHSNPDRVRRSDLFITTKVWNHLHSPEDVQWSLGESLRKLGLDYVDLYLLHYPVATEKDGQYQQKKDKHGKYVVNRMLTEHPEPTWRAMEALVQQGKTKAIGVSNWSINRLEQLLTSAEIRPAVNQIEIHPFFPNRNLVTYCHNHGVLPQAYSPLGSQVRASRPCGLVLENEELKRIAETSGHKLSQLLLAWGLKRGYVVLPKSFTPKRIADNFQIPTLTEEAFNAVQKIATRNCTRLVDISGEYDYENFWDDARDF